MRATKQYVERKIAEFNGRMFGGRLPAIPVELTDAGTFLGLCAFKTEKLRDGTKRLSDFKMRINTRVDLPEEVVEDVIIHEMIHYFIGYNGLQDTGPHGVLFKAMMATINAAYGRHIAVSHRSSTEEEKEQFVSERRTWHVIAWMRFRDGSHGVKVLPRIMPRIIDYHKAVGGDRRIVSIELYLHDDPWFNRFPTSAALKVHAVDGVQMEQHLAGARRLEIRGNSVVERGSR